MTRRSTSLEGRETSAAVLESIEELVVSIWRVLRLRKTRALVFRTGSSSEEQSRVRCCCKTASCGVEDGKLKFSEDWSIGLQTGVKKRLCSMLLRMSLTRMTSCIAGVNREGGSESEKLLDSLSNLNTSIKFFSNISNTHLICGRYT